MKFFIKTYGCQMNEYDSAKIADILITKLALEPTNSASNADLIVLNTCSVRAKAEEKLFSDLGRLRKLKIANPQLIIAVGGCVAMQQKQAILKRANNVDIVFGPLTLHLLPKMYQARLLTRETQLNLEAPSIEKFTQFPTPKAEGPTAFVSIMEGCNKFCSYCIVPYTRGREVSRPIQDILNEVQALSAQGVKEITLLGQNVNAYQDFVTLINLIANIDSIFRIRYTTSHPVEFTDELIDLYRTQPKLVDHLHLPVQSGSDKILAAMRRGYTKADYQNIVTKLRNLRPNISISSDFIVGFPGETAADFQETLDFIRTINFDHSFSFIYSRRPHTKAAMMPDTISLAEKKQRLASIQNQITLQTIRASQALLNTHQTVLVSGTAKKGSQQLAGRTSNNRVVNFTGPPSLIGKIVTVHITTALPFSLQGTLI